MSARGFLDAFRRVVTRNGQQEEWPSVVAHELRQPLGTILLALGPIAGDDDPHVQAAVRRIRSSVFKLTRMVEDLVDEAAISAGRLTIVREGVDLRLVVAKAVADAEHFAKGHVIDLVQPSTPALIDADSCRIEQVATNLLTNAVKYGESGAPIRVGVDVRPAAGMVVTSITNRGEGLTATEVRRVFDKCYRTERVRTGRHSGLGLGLYVARTVIEGHGGRVGVTTEPGETTFWFSLPLLAA
ncbi:MAG: sensor histidine kinase [Planctomycetota bacterium]